MEIELKKITDWQDRHQRQDDAIQLEIREFIKRAEPMLQVFEDNKIYRMKFKEETGTVIFYGKAILTIGGVAALLWALLKNFR